jgi:zinc and cadmium transporter
LLSSQNNELSIIVHESSQGITDFNVTIAAGFSRAKTLILNLATALAEPLGAVLAYFYLPGATGSTPYLLAIGAGVFVCTALSNLIPSIHRQSKYKYDLLQPLLFEGGIVLVSRLWYA